MRRSAITPAQTPSARAQVRLLALTVCDSLFRRSRVFRLALCNDLKSLCPLLLGESGRQNYLPPPPSAAAELRSMATECLGRWYRDYGPCIMQLRLAGPWLMRSFGLDLTARPVGERAAHEATRQARVRTVEEQRRRAAPKLYREIVQGLAQITQLLAQLRSCLDLAADVYRSSSSSVAAAVLSADTASAGAVDAAGQIVVYGDPEPMSELRASSVPLHDAMVILDGGADAVRALQRCHLANLAYWLAELESPLDAATDTERARRVELAHRVGHVRQQSFDVLQSYRILLSVLRADTGAVAGADSVAATADAAAEFDDVPNGGPIALPHPAGDAGVTITSYASEPVRPHDDHRNRAGVCTAPADTTTPTMRASRSAPQPAMRKLARRLARGEHAPSCS